MKKLTLGFLLLCSTSLPPITSRAATIQTEVSQRRVAVGQSFSITLITNLEDDEENATHPRISLPDSFKTRAPAVGSRRSFSFGSNGAQSQRSSSAKWQVVPQKAGSFTIGPGKIEVDGVEYKGERLSIVVVEASQGANPSPQRRTPFGTGGFDPWDLLQGNQLGRPAQLPDVGPLLEMKQAPNPIAFLRVVPEKDVLIVGEPMKVGLYLYGSQGPFPSPSASSPPALTQFKSFPIVSSALEQSPRQTVIDGTSFRVQKLQEWLVIPLQVGKLPLGEAQLSLPRSRRFGSRRISYGLEAKAVNQFIEVKAAPLQGRPQDFQSGNVGRFKLSALVTPRQVQVNDYFEVRLKVSGRGNLPSDILPPEVDGIIWNPPARSSDIKVKNSSLVGQRTLTFTAQATQAGQLKLGEVQLSYYDSQNSTYDVSKVDLGELNIRPAKQPQAAAGRQQSTSQDQKIEEPEIAADDILVSASPLNQLQGGKAPSRFAQFSPWLTLIPPSLILGILLLLKVFSFAARRPKGPAHIPAKDYLLQAQALASSHEEEKCLRHLEQALWSDAEEKIGRQISSLSDAERELIFTTHKVNSLYSQCFEKLLNDLRARRYGHSTEDLSSLITASQTLLSTKGNEDPS